MRTDLNEITVVLKPSLESVGITPSTFDEAYTTFAAKANGPDGVIGYCNLTFGRPTHLVTHVAHMGDHVYQARIGFLEGLPETGAMATRILQASLQDKVKWQFAVTKTDQRFEIFSIEAILGSSD